LVVVLPTGGGKSLLFLAPACLENPGVTIVVVPFRVLLNRLKDRLQTIGIDHIEWAEGTERVAAIVVVSADLAGSWDFLRFASTLVQKKILRRVVVDECHLAYTSSNYRERLASLRNLRSLACLSCCLQRPSPRVFSTNSGSLFLCKPPGIFAPVLYAQIFAI
jgi:superfamily II DNA helicase RecQ